MKKLIFTFALILSCVFVAKSQDGYQSAIGLRLGLPNSVSYKNFLNEKNAIEVFVGYRRWSRYISYLNAGALYQIHTPIRDVNGLQWYIGGGAAALIWSYDRDVYSEDAYGSFNLGIMGCLGLDYKFEDYPINLSIDWVPTFVIGDAYYDSFRADVGALSVRYTFR